MGGRRNRVIARRDRRIFEHADFCVAVRLRDEGSDRFHLPTDCHSVTSRSVGQRNKQGGPIQEYGIVRKKNQEGIVFEKSARLQMNNVAQRIVRPINANVVTREEETAVS